MEIYFKRDLTGDEKENIRQLTGYYRGIAMFKGKSVLEIERKEDFSKKEFMGTLTSMDVPIENVDVYR
ncbi:hypothetical protein [Evansella tamaricis]|uniref:Uncharacterized protein n=1 Tax=Evansella tamaricis TaxID=2069301 RepID=A0ABS6JB67_9BACI|nr:hypothetical protein [Evansella tamaricis]MBU9710923.1 hypothetical protein [Evansella tamaricis]